MSRSRIVIMLALAVMLVSAVGCSLGVRKAGSVVTGKKDSVFIITGHNESLTAYKAIAVEKLTSELGGETESQLCILHAEIVKQLEESKLFDCVSTSDSAPKDGIIVRGRIIDYCAGKKWKRIATIGGEAFVIVRFSIETADGKLLGEINSRGFVKDALTGGDVKDTAPLICNGLMNFLEDRITR